MNGVMQIQIERRRNAPIPSLCSQNPKMLLSNPIDISVTRDIMLPNAARLIYLPGVFGGADHCLSIPSIARDHSETQALVSFSIPPGLGDLPPHMAGLAASSRACFLISDLTKDSLLVSS